MRGVKKILSIVICVINLVIYPVQAIASDGLVLEDKKTSNEVKNVIIINSYHRGEIFEEAVEKGILSTLEKKENINYYIEYMGNKRNKQEEYYAELSNYYSKKYEDVEFDVVITSGADAFFFVDTYKKKLFKYKTMIFCGLNTVISAPEIPKKGIVQNFNLEDNLNLVLKYHTDINNILVVLDNSSYSQTIKNSINDILSIRKEGKNKNVVYINKDYEKNIQHYLKEYNNKAVVFFIGDLKDENNNFNSNISMLKKVISQYNVPIYTPWSYLLNANIGIIGGKVSNSYDIGVAVGTYTVELLEDNFVSHDENERLNKSVSKYIFDYNGLKKYNIDISSLPEESNILNKPSEVYSLPKNILWYISYVVMLILLILVANMIESNNKRIRAEHQKKNVEEANKVLIQAIEYDKLKLEFFSNMSHELRTPINVIFSTIQLLDLYKNNGKIQVSDKEDFNHKINAMKINCRRMLRLVNNIIDITKMDSGYMHLNVRNVNIVSLAEDITMSVVDYIESKNITLIFDTDVEEKVLACDVEKIERVLLNLLSNAVKFTGENGEIDVNVVDLDDKVQIKVKDNGIGIPEEYKEIIFEKFRQVDKSFKRNREGSGMGLTIAKSIVELHEGRILLNTEEGKGSEFIIELPVKINENQEVEEGLNEDDIYKDILTEFSDIY